MMGGEPEGCPKLHKEMLILKINPNLPKETTAQTLIAGDGTQIQSLEIGQWRRRRKRYVHQGLKT